jgi:hypothetical protein
VSNYLPRLSTPRPPPEDRPPPSPPRLLDPRPKSPRLEPELSERPIPLRDGAVASRGAENEGLATSLARGVERTSASRPLLERISLLERILRVGLDSLRVTLSSFGLLDRSERMLR